jgi:glutathione S-transferase
VKESRGKYSVGDEVTLADAFLIPQLYNAERFEVDL